MTIKIYHNPRCSKSRQTKGLMEEKGITPEVVEYLKTPPGPDELRQLLAMLGLGPRDLMRKKEKVYTELNLGDTSLSDDDLIKAMTENPILIERPIVVKDGKAALGRPPESVFDIL